jgi:hypothetical protein
VIGHTIPDHLLGCAISQSGSSPVNSKNIIISKSDRWGAVDVLPWYYQDKMLTSLNPVLSRSSWEVSVSMPVVLNGKWIKNLNAAMRENRTATLRVVFVQWCLCVDQVVPYAVFKGAYRSANGCIRLRRWHQGNTRAYIVTY